MSTPLLTICVITYNHADYIEEAIESILSQKVSFEWQLIVADDFSTDGTRDILEKYQKLHPKKIKLILQSKNVGPETNWLDLIESAKTKYVLYAEGDDYFSDNTKLQTQVDFLDAHPDYAMCFHPVTVVYQDGSRPNEIFPTAEQRFNKTVLTLEDLLKNNFIQTNSVLYRWNFTKRSIKAIYPKGISPGDWFLHILNAEEGKIGFIDREMAVYRKHSSGLWWAAEKNKNEFYQKFGVAWVKLYAELLKRYGSNVAYYDIISGNVINLLNALVKVDKETQSELFKACMSNAPEAIDAYIVNLRQQVEQIHAHADEQAKIIQHYVELNSQKDEHIRLLKGNLMIKLKRAVNRKSNGSIK